MYLLYCYNIVIPYSPNKDQTELGCDGHDSGIHCLTLEADKETKLYPTWYGPFNRPMLSQNPATFIDALGVPDHTPKLMSEPPGQFQQTETPLSMWMSDNLMPLSNKNQVHPGKGSLESTQPYMSEAEKTLCSKLVSEPARKGSLASVSLQVSSFSTNYGHFITITTPSGLHL